MEPLSKHEAGCTCRTGWFTDCDSGDTIPACACPIITVFASQLYWTLPESRRNGFAGIEAALCGTRTSDADELLRRFWIIFASAMRVNGKPSWQANLWQCELLEAIQDARYTDDFEDEVGVMADDWGISVCKGGPVSAWLAMDDLSELLVRAEAKQ